MDALAANPRKVFVGNLPAGYAEQDLRDFFSKVGTISKLELKQRFCFIEYEEESQAEAAHRELDGVEFGGQRIAVQPHDPLVRTKDVENTNKPQYNRPLPSDGRGPPRKHYRVCVFNLDENASWRDLKDYGRQIGEVNYSAVFHYQGQKVGVVEYLTVEEMKRALEEIPNLPFLGKTIRAEEDVGQLDRELAAANGYGIKRRSPPSYSSGPYGGRPRSRYPSPPRYRQRSRSPRRDGYDRRDRYPHGDDRFRRGYDDRMPPLRDEYYSRRDELRGGYGDRYPPLAHEDRDRHPSDRFDDRFQSRSRPQYDRRSLSPRSGHYGSSRPYYPRDEDRERRPNDGYPPNSSYYSREDREPPRTRGGYPSGGVPSGGSRQPPY
ncbi:RNA recognition motif. family protein [Cryptosporidium muris RN66]|uniref:RNA recognition motif. family protein n=1 Tax=Cryptosporidium muris (strain RN66) TaxID=441375 RepID=B6AC35_CRYMR|nr:RNA recognition motif. family protein [Cryptosporidium muris RN66]EEA05388.1 RNA recognition motif. family protein [Cryptosporidium muris RN66]|eukprot:XP_002139737.1 RNA recognition motif. family protein [Cryptosporidium muris RN66]